MAVTCCRLGTVVGTSRFVVVPSPSWPHSVAAPTLHRARRLHGTRVVPPPLIARTPGSVATVVGWERLLVVLSPICPEALFPQHLTLPTSEYAHEWVVTGRDCNCEQVDHRGRHESLRRAAVAQLPVGIRAPADCARARVERAGVVTAAGNRRRDQRRNRHGLSGGSWSCRHQAGPPSSYPNKRRLRSAATHRSDWRQRQSRSHRLDLQ